MNSDVNKKTFVIATRGSKLALWQSYYVKDLLQQQGVHAELKVIKTTGDRVQDRFLHEIGGKGMFVRELEEAMLRGEVDLAVHSTKDLPAKLSDEFALAAILPRHSARDVLIFGGRSGAESKLLEASEIGLDELKSLGSLAIGTSSLRRQSLLKSAGADLKLVPLRGNVDTRIAKISPGKMDAIVLAEAALERLELKADLRYRPFDPRWFVPSPAQGTLSIETLKDSPLREVLLKLDDPINHRCVTLERQILLDLGGDCTMPIGCYVYRNDDDDDGAGFVCQTKVLDYQGHFSETICKLPHDSAAWDIGSISQKVVANLAAAGVNDILKTIRNTQPDLGKLD